MLLFLNLTHHFRSQRNHIIWMSGHTQWYQWEYRLILTKQGHATLYICMLIKICRQTSFNYCLNLISKRRTIKCYSAWGKELNNDHICDKMSVNQIICMANSCIWHGWKDHTALSLAAAFTPKTIIVYCDKHYLLHGHNLYLLLYNQAQPDKYQLNWLLYISPGLKSSVF